MFSVFNNCCIKSSNLKLKILPEKVTKYIQISLENRTKCFKEKKCA